MLNQSFYKDAPQDIHNFGEYLRRYFPVPFGVVLLMCFFPGDPTAQIILSEIMFNPSGDENTNEFVELLNIGTNAVDLSGWGISDNSASDFIVGSGTILFPDRYTLVLDQNYFDSERIYDAVIPEEALILSIDGPTFGFRRFSNSTGETVHLIVASGDTLDSYTYTTDNDNGFSDEKVLLIPEDSRNNWQNSNELLGTPGKRNSVAAFDYDLAFTGLSIQPNPSLVGQDVTIRALAKNAGLSAPVSATVRLYVDADNDGARDEDELIDEISIDTALLKSFNDSVLITISWRPPFAGTLTIDGEIFSDPDDNITNNSLSITLTALEEENRIIISELMFRPIGTMPEWVELFNAETYELNLQNWRIRDRAQTNGVLISSRKVTLLPGQFIVLTGDTDGLVSFYSRSFPGIEVTGFPALNNDEDTIEIIDPLGRISDAVAYNSSWGNNPGVSLERVNLNSSSNNALNWGLSTVIEGATPGEVNSLNQERLASAVTIVPEPNPFSPNRRSETCVIAVTHPFAQSIVTMKIFDRYGRLVQDLVRGEARGSSFREEWDGTNNNGKNMLTDIYVIYIGIL